MRILKLEGLTKQFGDVVAVDHLNLEIEAGEIFGLLGPNGAGKSTTINIIGGLLRANQGKVEILGKDVRQHPGFTKQNLGIVPQDIAIYEDLTAAENVRFFAGLYGLRGRKLQERVEEALDFVGLSDKAKQYPDRFSGGMKRRLNIACAIAHQPQVMIMDEPTVGIDPQSRKHILQSVKRLNEMGCTIIYTSHYMEEVEEICSRVVIIDHGQIIAEGSQEEIKGIITNTSCVWITVDLAERVDPAGLKRIQGVLSVDVEDNVVKVNSANDLNNLNQVILYFVEHRMDIKNIENKTPDLETVFLTLTGRKLRD